MPWRNCNTTLVRVALTVACLWAVIDSDRRAIAQSTFTPSPNNLGGYFWSDAANWTGGVPNGEGTTASLLGGIGANTTLTINSAITLSTLFIGSPSYSYNVVSGAGGSLVLSAAGAGTGAISMVSGAVTQTISIPITVDATDNLQITQNSTTGTLSLGGITMGSGRTVSVAGVGRTDITALTASGTLTFANNSGSGTPGEVHFGSITAGGTLVFTGSGTGTTARFIIDGPSTLGAVRLIQSQTLQVNHSGVSWTTLTLDTSSATLELGNGVTIGSGNTLVSDGGSTKIVTMATGATVATYNGNISQLDGAQALRFSLATGQTLTLGGTFTAPGDGLDMVGAGRLVINNAFSSAGDNSLSGGGTLAFLVNADLGTANRLDNRGGRIELGNNVSLNANIFQNSGSLTFAMASGATTSQLVGKLELFRGTITFSADAGQTLTVASDFYTSSNASGTAAVKTGAGTVVLSGANSVTLGGATITVSQGNLILASAGTYTNFSVTSSGVLTVNANNVVWSTVTLISNAAGTGATLEIGNGVTIGSGNTLSISATGNSKTISVATGSATYAGNILNNESNDNINLVVGSGATFSITGTLGGTGIQGFNKEGAGTLALVGAVTHTFGASGALNINAGRVDLNSSYTLPRIALAGSSILRVNATSTISTLTISGTSQVELNAAATFSNLIVSAGTLSATSNLVTNASISTATLLGSGTSVRLSDGVTFNSGTITVSSSGNEKTFSLVTGATSGTISSPIAHLDNDAIRLVADTGQTFTFTGAFSGTNATQGGMMKLGAGTVVFTNTSSSYAPTLPGFFTSVEAGTLRIAAGGVGPLRLNNTGATLELSNGAVISETLSISSTGTDKFLAIAPGATSATFAGVITQADGDALHLVAADASQTLTISGAIANGAQGAISKDGAGKVVLANAANSFSGSVILTAGTLELAKLADSGVVSSLGTGTSTGNMITFSGGTLLYTGSGDSTNRAMSVTGSGTIANNGSGAISLTGAITGRNNATLTFGGSSGIFVGSALAQAAATSLSVTKAGSGTVTLNGTNTYSGGTNVLGGTLYINSTLSSPTVNISGGTLAGTGTVNGVVTLSGGTINFATSGTINNALNVASGGNWSGVGAVTGGVSVAGGTFNVGGTLAGNVTVAGGSLGGNGTIDGTVTINSGELAPGNSPGTLTLADLDMNGGNYHWQLATLTISDPGTNFDFVLVDGGNADLSNTAAVELDFSLLPSLEQPGPDDPFWLASHTWTILSVMGGGQVNGTFADLNQLVDLGIYGSGLFSLAYDTTNVYLEYNYTAVPEPGSLLLASLGALTLGGCGWRRRRKLAAGA